MDQEKRVDKVSMPPLGILAIIVSIGLAVYWGITETGPYDYLARLELRWMGRVNPALIWVVILLVMLVPAAIVAVLASPNWIKKQKPAEFQAQTLETFERIRSNADGFKLTRIRFVILLTGPILVGMGLWSLVPSLFAGPLTKIAARDLEDGKKPPSHYLEIEGVALIENEILIEKGSGSSKETTAYVPVNSDGKVSSKIAVFLEFNANESRFVPRETLLRAMNYRGTLSFRSPSAIVRQSAENDGLVLADPVYVLNYLNTPESDRNNGLGFLIAGILISGIAFFWMHRKSKERLPSR